MLKQTPILEASLSTGSYKLSIVAATIFVPAQHEFSGPHDATNFGKGLVSVGFTGGYARMSGIETLGDLLSHPPCFSNRIFRGNETNLDGSINRQTFFNETYRTMEVGKKVRYNINGEF